MLRFEHISLQMKPLINIFNVQDCKENGIISSFSCACSVMFDHVFMTHVWVGKNKQLFSWNLSRFEILFRWIVDNAYHIILNWHHLSTTFYHIEIVCKPYCANKHWIDIRYLNIMISYLANNMIDKLKKKIKFNRNEKHSVIFDRIYGRVFGMALKCTFTTDNFYHARGENFKDLKECIVDESHEMHNYGIIFKDLIKNIHLLCQNVEKMDTGHSDCNYVQFLKSDEWLNHLTNADAETALLIKDIVHMCVFQDCN